MIYIHLGVVGMELYYTLVHLVHIDRLLIRYNDVIIMISYSKLSTGSNILFDTFIYLASSMSI